MKRGLFFVMVMLAGCQPRFDKVTVEMYATGENKQKIGTIMFADTAHGLRINTDLYGLPAGEHGFHIHENPSCEAAADKNGKMQPAQAAGGHFDPEHSGKHLGPHGHGHRGDLPALVVEADGTAKQEFYLPDNRLKVADIYARSVIIHAGGDNYSDEPKPLGGGGARIACGVIK